MKMTACTAKLGELVTIVGGGTPSRDRPEYYNGGIPWMTVKDFNDDFFIRNLQEHISTLGVENSASRIIPAGNVILGTRMSVGKAAINLVDLAINQDLKALFCGSELNPRYLTFFLAAASPHLKAKASGATVKGITIDDVETLEIPLPSLSEQQRIAGLLEQADRLRRTRRYALELSDSFLPAAFLELFGDPAKNKHCWQTVPLREMCDNITDGTHDTPDRVKSGIPFITSKNIRPYEIDLANLDFVTPETHREIIKRCNPRFGDVLYTNIGVNVGNAVANRLRFEFSLKNVALIQPDFTKLNSAFLEALLNNSAFKESILRVSSVGGAQKFIALEVLRDIVAILPPLPLQQQFAALVERHKHLRATQREALRQAEHLFQTLLHRAFNQVS